MTTQMLREIREIPQVVARQLGEGAATYRAAGERLRRGSPRFLVTCARGSSDQAVTYFKYLAEMRIGIPIASVGPSVASIYGSRLQFDGGVLLSVSQSGGSPDLVSLQAKAREGGARAIALLNVTESAIGREADEVLPLLAGPEKAVAATKSFVASLVALASVVGYWSGDTRLIDALQRLPESIEGALQRDWSDAALPLAAAHSLFVIGRGPGLGIAGEAALKFKETCRLHAEAYSAAEVRHGPIALARDRFAALVFANGDESDDSVSTAVKALSEAGARVFIAGADVPGATSLTMTQTAHPALNPISAIVSFYCMAERLSLSLGENPDAPKLLRKVTETY